MTDELHKNPELMQWNYLSAVELVRDLGVRQNKLYNWREVLSGKNRSEKNFFEDHITNIRCAYILFKSGTERDKTKIQKYKADEH